MTASRRWALWLILLPIAAGLAFPDGGQVDPKPSIVPAATRTARTERPERKESAATPEPAKRNDRVILAIEQRSAPARVEDFFDRHDWTQPPPGSPAAAPPPPAPPPLPYTVLGRKLEDGAWQVFLAAGDNVYIVKQGDVLDDTYRVDGIEASAMQLTYLPLDVRQTLLVGGEP